MKNCHCIELYATTDKAMAAQFISLSLTISIKQKLLKKASFTRLVLLKMVAPLKYDYNHDYSHEGVKINPEGQIIRILASP